MSAYIDHWLHDPGAEMVRWFTVLLMGQPVCCKKTGDVLLGLETSGQATCFVLLRWCEVVEQVSYLTNKAHKTSCV